MVHGLAGGKEGLSRIEISFLPGVFLTYFKSFCKKQGLAIKLQGPDNEVFAN